MDTVRDKKSRTKEEARKCLKQARYQRKNGDIKRTETHIYKCEKYHLTSNAGWRKKLKRKLKKL